jgi:Domain of unknown function (DUF4160)
LDVNLAVDAQLGDQQAQKRLGLLWLALCEDVLELIGHCFQIGRRGSGAPLTARRPPFAVPRLQTAASVLPIAPVSRRAGPSRSDPRLRRVPRIASFEGLVVKLYFNDHPPPHVHVYAGRIGRPGVQAARISINTGEVTDGKLALAKLAAVRSWCERHREALIADWQRAQLNLHPTGRYDQ